MYVRVPNRPRLIDISAADRGTGISRLHLMAQRDGNTRVYFINNQTRPRRSGYRRDFCRGRKQRGTRAARGVAKAGRKGGGARFLDVPADVRGIFSASSPINYSSSGCFRFHRESLPPSAKKSNWTLPARVRARGTKTRGPIVAVLPAPRLLLRVAAIRELSPSLTVQFRSITIVVTSIALHAARLSTRSPLIGSAIELPGFDSARRSAARIPEARTRIVGSTSLSFSLSRVEERAEESASRGEFVRESSNFRARLPANFLLDKERGSKRERERERERRPTAMRFTESARRTQRRPVSGTQGTRCNVRQ